MPLDPEKEKLLTIIAEEVKTYVRAELERERIQMRAEVLETFGKRLTNIERDLGIEGK